VVRWLQGSGIRDGLLTLFVRHTSASLIVQDNADPTSRAIWTLPQPPGTGARPLYRHTQEGPDDMPAHVRAALTQTQLSIPVRDGRMLLGTWQGSICSNTDVPGSSARLPRTCWRVRLETAMAMAAGRRGVEAEPPEVEVVIEIPRGSFLKRGSSGRIDFVSPLPCPFNYGSVPDYLGLEGDLLDALVLGPAVAGTRIRVRAWGR